MKIRHYLILFFLPFSLLAETIDFSCKSGILAASKAAAELEKVQAKYEQIGSFYAKFEQDSYLAALDINETSSGEIWFLKPGQIKWHYKAPEEQVYLLTDNTFWHYQQLDNLLTISEFSQVFQSKLPVSFLFGQGVLIKDFDLKQVCKYNTSGLVFKLTPKNSSLDGLKELDLLYVNGDLAASKIIDSSGNTTAVKFEQVKFGSNIRKAEFELDYPKNVDVNDLREEK